MTSQIRQLSFEEAVARLQSVNVPARQSYLAMYSTWYGGIIRDPQLMMLPVDDHIVHRGDGVFEATKCVDGRVFALDRHLDRLMRSADVIGLKPPHTQAEIREICLETARAAGARDCMLRLYVSRGPGGFTANPYESIGSQMYLVITPFKPMPAAKYESGVSVRTSQHRVKEGVFATVKSCNYLQNVMMKKEAVDSGCDFTISLDEEGHLAEGSTENFAIISEAGEFLVPKFDRILRGVTLVRMMELAEELMKGPLKGKLIGIRNKAFGLGDVAKAREAMMLGTTLDALPVTTYDGKPVGDGRVGPVMAEFIKVMREDLKHGPLVTTLY